MWKPFDGIADSGGGGGGGPNVVALVVFHCGPEVETVFGVWVPAFTYGWEDVGVAWAAWGCKGGFVVVEGAVNVCVGGQPWIEA